MKLAFVIFKYFPYGGAQRDMLRIARDCAARGHEVRIYTGQWRGDPPGEGIEVVLLPVSGGLNHRRHRRLIDAITARLRADEPDLVVGFNRMPGLDVYYAADPCFIERAHAERMQHDARGEQARHIRVASPAGHAQHQQADAQHRL